MEELDRCIAMQKAEIHKVSQDLVTASNADIVTNSALANIAIPSNLQQILDSIKTISPGCELKGVKVCLNISSKYSTAFDFQCKAIIKMINNNV